MVQGSKKNPLLLEERKQQTKVGNVLLHHSFDLGKW